VTSVARTVNWSSLLPLLKDWGQDDLMPVELGEGVRHVTGSDSWQA
jgi:hypothetical protein